MSELSEIVKRHKPTCASFHDFSWKCNCGADETAAELSAKDAEIARLKAAANESSKAMKMLISHVRCPDCGSNKHLPYAHKDFCYYLKVDEELTAALQEAK